MKTLNALVALAGLTVILVFGFSGCSSDEESSSGGSCENGALSCADDGITVLKCVDGKWEEQYQCNTGFVCINGECKPEPENDGDIDSTTEIDSIDFILPDGDEEAEEEEPARGCTSDRDCVPVSDYYCDRSSGFGVCKRRLGLCEPCQTHRQCGMDEDMCITSPTTGEKVCGRYCVSDMDCPNGFKCMSNQCALAEESVGTGACCTNADCTDPSKPACNPLTHRCMPGCTDDGECPSGQVCVDGVCKEGCASSQDCPSGFVCDPDTKKCIEGECIDKYDCPLEHLCDTQTHTCVEGCEDDSDCYGANECKNGQCVERTGCRHTGDCKLGMFCDFSQPDPQNPDRGTCRPLFPEGGPYSCCACNDHQDCNYNGKDGYCVEFRFEDENGNPIPGKVNYKACVYPVDCKRRDDEGNLIGTYDCPRGFTCGELEVQSPSGTQKFGICVIDCNNFCTIPYFDEVNICDEAGRPSVCPLQ